MAIATFNKFNSFVYNLGTGIMNLSSDVLKLALTNVAPAATNTVFSNLTEIAAGNGYTAGGIVLTTTSYSQSGGTAKLILAAPNPGWTATGGTMASFRYYALYDSSASGSPLVGWWDYGSIVSLTVGQTFTPVFDAVNGVLQAA
jgi:hypothetical protein